jgi:hypothetical protein
LLPPGSVSQPVTALRIEPTLGLPIPGAVVFADAPDELQVAPLNPPLSSAPLASAPLSSPPLSAPLPPAPPARTARLKTAASSAPAIAPAADGKLPALQLADDPTLRTAEGGEKSVPLWLACVAIAGSTVLSVFLLLGDAPARKSLQSRTAEVRQEVAGFFGNDAAALRPYQVLLREAQQAHSRGDHATKKQRYRQVLALLRSEKRSRYENVTGSPGDDERLAELLAILLSAE